MTSPAVEALAGRRVAVTGAGGFIGSHLVHALVRCGAHVTAVAPQEGWRPPPGDAVRFVRLDPLAAATAVAETTAAVEGAELVVHLAYDPPPPGSNRALFEAAHNVAGTLRFARALPPSVRHVCFASSVMVYGPRPPVPVPEQTCPRPVSDYAIGKLAAEQFLGSWAADTGAGVSVLRYSTVYGPWETVPRAVPNFIRQALAGRAPVIRGDGAELRDYVHVDDAVHATLLALARGRPGYDVFNVASGQGRSTRAVAERVVALAGGPPPAHVAGPGTTASIVCDVSHARRQLGYEPRVEFDAGLESEIAWFRSRPDLW